MHGLQQRAEHLQILHPVHCSYRTRGHRKQNPALTSELAWAGHNQDDCIHATSDPYPVRNAVFDLISQQDFRVDATILEKSKAQPQTRSTEIRFYQYAWRYHFKYVAPQIFKEEDEA